MVNGDLEEFKKLLKQVEKQGLDLSILSCSNSNFYGQDWQMLSADPDLTEQLLTKYCDFLDWKIVSKHYKFDLAVLKRFEDRIDWMSYSKNESITEEIMRYYKDRLYWFDVLSKFKMNVNLIREFKDYIDFSYLVRNKEPKVKILKQFSHKFDDVDWKYISYHNNLSDEFIERNSQRLTLGQVVKHCTSKLLKKRLERLNVIKQKTDKQ